jgi:L-ascorbate metabolism protein UlaG (beta-lactamase superfamily)
MKIVWHGHACFSVENSLTVVFDPHDGESIGLHPPDVKGDIILVSHHHFDHDAVRVVSKENSTLIDSPGTHTIGEIQVKSVQVFHDPKNGSLRGPNIIHRMEYSDITFCHLGDLGHVLTENVVKELLPVDILFIPVGGKYTIDHKEAKIVADQLKPSIVIPMHYQIPGLTLGLDGVETFVEGMDSLKLESNVWELPEKLPDEKAVVFKYSGR